jgi:iron(III) transport system substrate-binding protein
MQARIALGLFVALLAGDAGAQAPAIQAPATQAPTIQVPVIADIAAYAGPDRTQRLIAGAKKEGGLTLYSSGPIEDTTAITYAFEKKYGVPVRLWRGSSEDILRRAMAEARGSRYEVDVAETAGPEMEALGREKLMQAIESPVFAELIPQAATPRRAWVMSRLSVFATGINTNLVKADDAPRSYEDLADPKWKGKLGIEADDAGWFLTVLANMGESDGLKLFRTIVGRNGMSIRKGHTLLANLVAAGEVPLALTVYGYRIEAMKKAGAPISGVILPPAVALPTGIAVFRRAPHPNAAVLFVDFVLSDGQRILADRGNVPTNARVKEPPSDLNLIDSAKLLDGGDKWSKLFQDVFVSQGR